jgi:hypothetical protein
MIGTFILNTVTRIVIKLIELYDHDHDRLIQKYIEECITEINQPKLITRNFLIKRHIREQYIIKEILHNKSTDRFLSGVIPPLITQTWVEDHDEEILGIIPAGVIPPLIPPSWMNSVEDEE